MYSTEPSNKTVLFLQNRIKHTNAAYVSTIFFYKCKIHECTKCKNPFVNNNEIFSLEHICNAYRKARGTVISFLSRCTRCSRESRQALLALHPSTTWRSTWTLRARRTFTFTEQKSVSQNQIKTACISYHETTVNIIQTSNVCMFIMYIVVYSMQNGSGMFYENEEV